MADTVSLEVARDSEPLPLVHMVLGGVAVRRNLSFDALDDLQLAVDNILAEDVPPGGTLSMAVTVSEDSVGIRLEPLRNRDLRATLLDGKVPAGAESRCIDVCLLLRSLVDDYSIGDLSEDAYAVELLKRIGQ
jgi:hypothetical protein